MGELGTRYKCFKCESKFYDLKRPDPICPICGENQNNKETKQLFKHKKKRWASKTDTDMHVLPEDSDALSESVDSDSLVEPEEEREDDERENDEYLLDTEDIAREDVVDEDAVD